MWRSLRENPCDYAATDISSLSILVGQAEVCNAESWVGEMLSQALFHCVQNWLCKTVKIYFVYLYGVVREDDELEQSSYR